jgi:lipoprotein-releasing system ATP-binding protein
MKKIGLSSVSHYLLAEYNAEKCHASEMKLAKYSIKNRASRDGTFEKLFDMQDQALKMPNQLSGGQNSVWHCNVL